jgi:hypothetical protein
VPTISLSLCERSRGARVAPPASIQSRDRDLRHSFAPLLLAEGRQPLYVARQLGHSVSVLFFTYAHLIDEYEELDGIDAASRSGVPGEQPVRVSAASPTKSGVRPRSGKRKPRDLQAFG